MPKHPDLTMRTFTVRVAVIPTVLEQKLFGASVHYETKTITGYTLKDAKKRAGIQ